MNNAISRQDAIDALNDEFTVTGKSNAIVVQNYVFRVAKRLQDLPPVQPEPSRINLNDLIKVKLTDWGKDIYYHQWDETNQIAGREICKPMFPKEDENGYTKFQLWCFMELYGKHMGIALPNVIEPIELIYIGE